MADNMNRLDPYQPDLYTSSKDHTYVVFISNRLTCSIHCSLHFRLSYLVIDQSKRSTCILYSMAPFPIVTMKNFGSKSLISYLYLYTHTLETRAEDNLDSRSSQQISLTIRGTPSRIITEIGGPTDTTGANWHNIHGPYTLKHLSFWTYLALGLIVLWISFVTIYACFRCCRAHIIRLDISDGENPQVYEKGSMVASKRNGRLQKRGWKRERNISVASSEVCWQKISRMLMRKYLYRSNF